MKTEISIPNPIFEAAQQLAQQLNMSLSELYTAALAAYVAEYQNEDVTEKLNQVYETEPSNLEPDLVTLQLASIIGPSALYGKIRGWKHAAPAPKNAAFIVTKMLKAAIDDWLRGHDSRTILLQQAGALATDETLPQLRETIYTERGRSEVEKVVPR